MQGYWRVVLGRAFDRAVHQLDLGRGRLVIAILLGAIYLLLVWTLIDLDSSKAEIALKVAASIAPFIAWRKSAAPKREEKKDVG